MSAQHAGGDRRVLRAVIFDLDGVLVTTDHFHYRGWKRLTEELGMHFSPQDNHLLRGVSRAESLKIIYRINDRPLPDDEEFTQQMTRKNGYYVEFISQMTPRDVLPGSVELLDSLREEGIARAIASSSRNAGLVLERTGLAAYMEAVSDGNSIAASKPDPEVFLRGAALLGIPPWNCVGVEDAAAGVASIRRAGMVSLGVGEQAREADAVVGGIAEVTLAMLRELFEANAPGVNEQAETLWSGYRDEMSGT